VSIQHLPFNYLYIRLYAVQIFARQFQRPQHADTWDKPAHVAIRASVGAVKRSTWRANFCSSLQQIALKGRCPDGGSELLEAVVDNEGVDRSG
jgi:hypothetical protein